MRRLILLWALPAALAAQGLRGGADSTAPSTPAEDLCTVEGKVLNAVTLEPVKKARIELQRTTVLRSQSGPSIFGTTSDDVGNFAMKDIEPGQYRVQVSHNGFVPAQYGARAPGHTGVPIVLARKQQMRDLEIRMTPHGVVAGRVLDEDGEPVSNAQVQLLAARYSATGKQLTRAGGGATDDLGEYRVFGLAPGKYFLAAAPAPTARNVAPEPAAAGKREESYVATYYPRAIDASGATTVEVVPGQPAQGLEIRLMKAHTVHIRGTVTTSVPGRHTYSLFAVPRTNVGYMGYSQSYPVEPTGRFNIHNVPAGSYSVQAIFQEGPDSYSGRTLVEVGEADVEDVVVSIGEGVSVSGHIAVDGDAPASLSSVRVALRSRADGALLFNGGPMRGGTVNGANIFELLRVSPDAYNITVSGLPAGYYVKSIRAGALDVLANGLDVGGGPPPPLEVLFSSKAAAVSGTVQDEKTGQPCPGATVVMVPREKERVGRYDLYRQATADQSGVFRFQGVTPGDYRILAFDDIEPGGYMDPDYMKAFESSGVSVNFQENDKPSLQLKLISTAGK